MATPFIRFPGGVGDNVWSDGVNFLDGDTAHTYKNAGDWRGVNNLTITQVDDSLFYSGKAANADVIAAGLAQMNTPLVPAVAGQDYVGGILVKAEGVASRARVTLQWYDAGTALVGSTPGTFLELAPNDSGVVSETGTAPTNTTQVRVSVFLQDPGGSDPGSNVVQRISNCFISDGSEQGFVPSLNIVGASFVSEVANPTPVDYTVGALVEVGDGWAGDLQQWALHDGATANDLIVAQVLALDALRAIPL